MKKEYKLQDGRTAVFEYDANGIGKITVEVMDYLIDMLPKWIPCSERLPDAQTEVIVSCMDDLGDTRFLYTSSGWVTTDGEYWIVDNEINGFVIAWMPLPEPYKGENAND